MIYGIGFCVALLGPPTFLIARHVFQDWQAQRRIEEYRDREDREVAWLDDLFFHTPAVEPWQRWLP